MIALVVFVGLIGVCLWVVGRRLESRNRRTVEQMVLAGQLTPGDAAVLLWCLQTGAALPADFFVELELERQEDELVVPADWEEQ